MAKAFKGLSSRYTVTQDDGENGGIIKIAEFARRDGDKNPKSKIVNREDEATKAAKVWDEEKDFQESRDIASAIAILERKGMLVEQPTEKGGNYVVMDSSCEVLVTRRIDDVISAANYVSQGGKIDVTKRETDAGKVYTAEGSKRKLNTQRPRDIKWLINNGSEVVFG